MIRTRIAPSPTGANLHIGTIYTAYINAVVAQQSGGRFVMRIEDTDRTRFVVGAEERFIETLTRYGITTEENPVVGGPYAPYRQSERLEMYTQYAHKLLQNGYAYICTCTKERLDTVRAAQKQDKKIPRYDGHCRDKQLTLADVRGTPFVIRMRMPEAEDITFHDLIRGDITINTRDMDDQVILKADGFPTYHLAVVVDDALMHITHVIRAEEWINSTPKHILLYRYLQIPSPIFCHVPLLRNPDKSKLSKRKNPVWASWFLEQGFLPDAMVNFLSLMGWSHPQGLEIFSREEFRRVFRLEDMRPVGPAFDIVKLTWLNGEYIRLLSTDAFIKTLTQYISTYKSDMTHLLQKHIASITQAAPLVQSRIKTLAECLPLCIPLWDAPLQHEISLAPYNAMLQVTRDTLVQQVVWSAQSIGDTMLQIAAQHIYKKSEYFMAIRVALFGTKISLPLNESMVIMGKERVLQRLKHANDQYKPS